MSISTETIVKFCDDIKYHDGLADPPARYEIGSSNRFIRDGALKAGAILSWLLKYLGDDPRYDEMWKHVVQILEGA